MSLRHRKRWQTGMAACLLIPFCVAIATPAMAYNKQFARPPADKNVTIANGGLAITFNIAWGAVVVAVADRRVAHGLSIVDANDVGRELQVCQFLQLEISGRRQIILNPTQAGALGNQPFYQHPNGMAFPERGSPVVSWKAERDHFHAVIRPWDYDTAYPTRWLYVEDVAIDARGVAHFHYTFRDNEPKVYLMMTEVPTLYSDRTGAYMYPLVSPYGPAGALLRREKRPHWPVKVVTGAPAWPQKSVTSKGWIANIDAADDIGVFYTTPVGLAEDYGNFTGYDVSDRMPLGKTNVMAQTSARPGAIYSVEFSVLVSTPRLGPALIAKQPAAVFRVVRAQGVTHMDARP
jgi:hypothetical protein